METRFRCLDLVSVELRPRVWGSPHSAIPIHIPRQRGAARRRRTKAEEVSTGILCLLAAIPTGLVEVNSSSYSSDTNELILTGKTKAVSFLTLTIDFEMP